MTSNNGNFESLTRAERLFICRKYGDYSDLIKVISMGLHEHINRKWLRSWAMSGYSVEALREHLLESGGHLTKPIEYYCAANICKDVFFFFFEYRYSFLFLWYLNKVNWTNAARRSGSPGFFRLFAVSVFGTIQSVGSQIIVCFKAIHMRMCR